MANLTRRGNMFEDLFDFRRDVDELFNRLQGGNAWPAERGESSFSLSPPIETWMDKDGKSYHVRAALPGVEPQNVQLNVQSNALSIHAERKQTQENKDANYIQREFTYGSFDRVLPLPQGVEAEKVTAEFNNGVLEITAPVSAAALPRRVEVKSIGAKSKTAGA